MKQKIKLLHFNYPNGWGDGEFTLEIAGKKYYIHDSLVVGHYSPEGNRYYVREEGENAAPRLIYQNCKRVGRQTDVSNGHKLMNVVLDIGSAATVARILQGYEVEHTGKYFNTFINDNGERQAIVYPFIEMEWEKFKGINEAYREDRIFEKNVKKELLEKGFAQNKGGFWVQYKDNE